MKDLLNNKKIRRARNKLSALEFKRISFAIGLILVLMMSNTALADDGGIMQHTAPHWQATYWNNTSLSGTPVLEEAIEHLGFDWGYGSPHPSVNTDHFSVRWSRYVELAEATYRFSVTSDDGVRVYVDGRLIIDQWNDHPARTFTHDLALQVGHHHIVVEYYENTGVAKVALAWSMLPAGTGQWQAEYYDNRTLNGSPVRIRVDDEIDFDWRYGSPAPHIPNDDFSIRWTRTVHFEPGTYRFTTTTDDGVRLWVNNHLLIDKWYDQASQPHSGTIYVSGKAPIRMEYYENGGVASARLTWMRLGDAPPSSPGQVTVDDDGPGFVQGGSSGAWHTAREGYGGSLTWTRNNDWARPNYNWARWYPELAAGRYEVLVYVPERYTSTSKARYWVSHCDGYTLRLVDQAANGGRWVSLGTYRFCGVLPHDHVALSDVTYEPYVSRLIAFDAVKWVPASATPAPPTPTPVLTAERILFAPGATQTTVEGYLPANGAKVYVMRVAAGQFIEMNATVGTIGRGLRFSIVGADGAVVKAMGEAHVRTIVPSTQGYYVELVSDVGAVSYRMSVLIPVRIRFAPGATSATVTGSLEEGDMRHYVLRALAGQRMIVAPHTTTGQVGLVISGADGQVLLSGRVGRPGGVYDGILPATQDYLITVRAEGGTGADYTLEITIPAEEAESGITIVGTVMDVSLSARIIMLREPVEGFDVIALTEESELVSTDGDEITLRDIRPGMRIEASGQPGKSNALLASQVLVLDATPTNPTP